MKCGKKRWVWAFLFIMVFAMLPSTGASAKSQTNGRRGQTQLKNVLKAGRRNGKWIKSAGRYKFRFLNGTYASSQWINVKGKIYYFNKEGFRVSGWKKYRNYRYFLNKKGELQTGWFSYKNGQYYANTRTGVIRTGWFTWHRNKYYFGKDGKMAKGWLKHKGKKYYLRQDGTRTTGDAFIDGQWYHFKNNGVYDPKAKVTPKIDPQKPMVALTFDDGPGPYTERLLDCIERNKVRATFFLVGQSVPVYPNAVRRQYQLKCEIGNHTYNHPQLTRIADSQISAQINSTNTSIRNITGHNATLLRPPYGSYNASVNALAGTPVILWSIDTRDWETKNTQSTVNAVLNYVRDGDIILMHDIHLPTVAAAEIIIPELLNRGYQMVTVSELGYYKRGGLANGSVYSSLY